MKTEKESAIEIEESYKEKPVKNNAQGLLNPSVITSPSLASLCHILYICNLCKLESATCLAIIKTNISTGYNYFSVNNFRCSQEITHGLLINIIVCTGENKSM